MTETGSVYCSRCKATTMTDEWVYVPKAFFGNGAFKHTCGWMTKIPQKV